MLLLRALLLLAAVVAARPAAADTGLICSGNPWIDVRCPAGGQPGAVGDGMTDDTASIQAVLNAAVVNGWAVQFGNLTYKVTGRLTLDYQTRATTGIRLLSTGARLDGRTIAAGPVLQVQCSGGTPGAPTDCFYFRQEGTLSVLAQSGPETLATLSFSYSAGTTVLGVSTTAPFYVGQTVWVDLSGGGSFAAPITAVGAGTITLQTGLSGNANVNAVVWRPSYAVVLGKPDFSDAHNALKLDHLLVNNGGNSAGAGGCQFNYVLDSDIWAVCDTAGGAAGMALEQVQFSRISGSGTAAATGGRGLVIENGYNNSNTFFGLDLETSPICLSITGIHDGMNTFVSPYFACNTAVEATGSTHNLLINPTYAGSVINRGPQTGSIQVLGTGNRRPWQFPAISSYTAAGIDDKTCLSSFNATAGTLAVTLPAPLSVENGWSMCFVTDNNKGIILTPASGNILGGGRVLSSLTLGAGNYEYVKIESDGDQYRIASASRGTLLANGVITEGLPGARWLFPSPNGYSAGIGDNGFVVSSFNTSAGLTLTLPSTTDLPAGWSIGVVTDNGKGATIQVNGTAGGSIAFPRTAAATQNAIALAGYDYEVVMLQYDGSGVFRVVQATPATAQAIGLAGPRGLRDWKFPSSASYVATKADDGIAVSSFNSPQPYFTLTLPPASTIVAGFTMAIASDNGKATGVQVSGSGADLILIPGTMGAQTSLSLSTNTSGYELAWLQFDGSNWRVLSMTPLSANAVGMSLPIGTPASSSDTCQTGATQTDGAYAYWCVAPNTWKRVPLSTF
jgi:hypothetical protein